MSLGLLHNGARGLFSTSVIILCLCSAARASTISTSRDYKKVQEFLVNLSRQYSGTTQLFSVGVSGTGEIINGVKIGSGSIHNLIVATHHGNEYGSTEVALGAAAALAKSPISNQTVYVIPVLNISGFNSGQREESVAGNLAYDTADANRDYPGPCGSEGPFKLRSTKALADFIAAEGIVASATLHTFYPAVVYPWGMATHDLSTAYDKIFVELGKQATYLSRYEVGNSNAVIYPANGTFEDYAFWKHGVWSMLFELGQSHSPGESAMQEMVRLNVPGLIKMFENAPVARASDHEFKGKCDGRLRYLDRHDE